MSDYNDQIINEFRANGGKVGGSFAGAPMVLVHHRGRTSGTEMVSPLMYLPDPADANVINIFATKGGAPSNPGWYYNLTTAGKAVVEVGTETYPVLVREVTGEERDRIYAEQARRFPGFAQYETKTEGIRIIPVLQLVRA